MSNTKQPEFIRDQDGFIDWRAMVKDEYLYPNASHFERNGATVPKDIKGLKDHQLLIKLGGIKHVAKLRGFKSVKYDITHVDKDYVVAKCSIVWKENEEQGEVEFEDVANATSENCSGFTLKFLETIAVNRAFVRAVRNFLGIHIVGDDEIDKSDSTEAVGPRKQSKLCDTLRSIFSDSFDGGSDFESFKKYLRRCWKDETYRCDQAFNWKDFSDIPPSEARKIIAVIKRSS